jgi:cellobiose-specific phosphotransferase system component IIC
VSYALAVAISTSTFVAWWVLIGVSTEDNRIFYWLGTNSVVLVVLQPWMMRLSRVIYMRFFVGFDKDYKQHKPKEFE